MNIRKAKIDDFEQVYLLLLQLWPDAVLERRKLRTSFSRAVKARHHHYLCALERKTVVGFCSLSIRNSLWQQGRLAHIDEMVVDRAYRKHGIGTALMNKAMKIAESAGCSRMELDSAFHRKRAHTFYEQLGFENRAYLFSIILNGKT